MATLEFVGKYFFASTSIAAICYSIFLVGVLGHCYLLGGAR